MNLKKKICLLIGSIGVALILGGAGSDNDEVLNYFPLHVGDVRIYKSGLTDMHAESREEVSSYDKEFNSYMVSKIIKLYDLAPFIIQNVFEARNGKILLLAGADLKTGNLKLKVQPDILLSSPVKAGTVWEYENDHGDRIIDKIVGFENVTVNAGIFNDVCVVEETLYGTPPNKSKRELISVERMYYAAKVGLIKHESIGSVITKTGAIKPYKKHKTPWVLFELTKYSIR